MSVLNVKLLGQMECRLPAGDLFSLSTRKSEVLLAYLALNPGVRHPREKLTSLLWSDRSEGQARNSLRQTLSRLKKTFEKDFPGLLDINRTTVALSVDHIQVDVLEFERLVSAPITDNQRKAKELYRGEFLEGISIRDTACQEWLATTRERLDRLLVELLSNLSLLQIEESRYKEAIESSEWLLSYDPFQESVWRLLMTAYHAVGDRNHALLAYKRCCKILDIELGVEPDVKTKELQVQIRQGSLKRPTGVGRGAISIKEPCWDTVETHSNDKEGGIASSSLPKPAKNPESYDCLLQGWYHAEKHNPVDTAIAIKQFRKCIEINPEDADAHAILAAELHVELFENWSTDRKLSLQKSCQHIEMALLYEPDNALVHAFFAEHLLFKREFERAGFHADKAFELNQDLPDSCSMRATVLVAIGRYDKARKYADLSLQLDPHHPYSGWNGGQVYRSIGDYNLAIRTFRRIPHIPTSLYAEIAACYAGLGRYEEARAQMGHYQELARKQMPNYPSNQAEWHRLWSENVPYQSSEDIDNFFDLLLAAGLCDDLKSHDHILSCPDTPSIAVLAFENLSGDSEQDYFCCGITNDIITALSRLKNLRIVARNATLPYKNQAVSMRQFAEQQGVRYFLEGGVRKNGNKIRVNVAMVESRTAGNCWAEQYDRELGDIFAVQDDITRNIKVAMQVFFSGGDRDSRSAKGTPGKRMLELCMVATDLQDSYIKENILEARRVIKAAIKLDSGYSNAWVVLGWSYWQEVYCGWSESTENSMEKASDAARTALELNPSNAEAWALTGLIHMMQHQTSPALDACQKAIDLAPGNAEVQAVMASALCFAGEYKKAETAHLTSLRLCQSCPNWYIKIGGVIDLFFGNVDQAIKKFRQGIDIEPDSPLCRCYLVDALMEIGEAEEARAVVEEIQALDELFDVSGLVRMRSHDSAERERFLGNLIGAGL